MRHTKRIRPATTAVIAAGLLLAACGDDDGGTAEAGDGTAPAAEAGASSREFCDAAIAVASPPPPDVDFETASEAEITAAARTWARDVMRPLADDVEATAPSELSGDVAVLSAAVDRVADTGDLGAFETPEATAAGDRFDQAAADTCGWTRVEVTAVDYRFEGLPTELPPGLTSIQLSNDGAEPHELALFRKNDGVTLSLEELLALPEGEAEQHLTFVGTEPVFAEPGNQENTVVDLEPGEYVALCFVPVGDDEDGEPHLAHGMSAELTVED